MKRLAVALAVIAVILVALDRVGVVVADVALEGTMRDQLQLDHKPKVRVHGIPFLTQVVGGTYDDVEIDATDLDTDRLHDLDVSVRLHGVHLPLRDLGRWDFSSVPIDHVEASVTVPYATLVAAAGLTGVTVRAVGSALRISGRVTVAGQAVEVTATAHPSVRGGTLLLNPQQAAIGGLPVPPAFLTRLRQGISLTDLPFNLSVRSVRVSPDGLVASATADHVTIRNGQLVTTG